MKSSNERHNGWPLIIGIIVGVLALTAGPALAALTFSGTSIAGDGAVAIDSSSTISIGTSTATGVTIGNASGIVSLPGPLVIGASTLVGSPMEGLGGLNIVGDSGGSNLYLDMAGFNSSGFVYPVHQFFESNGSLASPTALSNGNRVG